MPAPCPVLCYHAVTDEPGLPAERLHAVTPGTLRRQLEWLAAHYTVVPLAELAQRPSVAGLAAVTFDDGYRSAVEAGWPVLRAMGLPATFFLIGEGLRRGTFWRERVRTVIRHGLVETFLAFAGDHPAAAGLTARRVYKDSKAPDRDVPGLDGLLQAFLAERGLDPRDRNACLDDLSALPDDPGFAVGNHSDRHYVASGLSAEAQAAEIAGGRAALAGRETCPFYAVPFGGAGDLGAATLRAARAAGYAGVLLSRAALNGPDLETLDGLLAVDRIMPADDPHDPARRIG